MWIIKFGVGRRKFTKKEGEEPRLECDGDILRGFGCNEGEIPFAAEADNERYASLTKEKEELEDENNRLRRLKYVSQANISTYTDIDSFIRDNITNISPTTSNWTTDTTIPTINVYTYDGDGQLSIIPKLVVVVNNYIVLEQAQEL